MIKETKKIARKQNLSRIPKMEASEAVLTPCNLIKNDYPRELEYLDMCLPGFGQLLEKNICNNFFSEYFIWTLQNKGFNCCLKFQVM